MDAAVGMTVMPYRVEDELRKRGANFVQAGLFTAFAVRDQNLITGQQQYSGTRGRRAGDRGARGLGSAVACSVGGWSIPNPTHTPPRSTDGGAA
jgi:hypothetical protein